MSKRGLVVGGAVLAALVVFPGQAQAAAREYQPVELPSAEEYNASGVADINDSGTVVGYSILIPYQIQQRPLRWDGNSIPVDLGTLGGDRGRALAINNPGTIVGEAQTAAGAWRAVRWDSQGIRDLGTVTGDDSGRAVAVNDRGVSVGMTGTAAGLTHPVRWNRHGVITALALPSGYPAGTVTGITEHGVAYGQLTGTGGEKRAVLWDPDGSARVLSTLGGTSDTVSDVTECGVAVGQSDGRPARWAADGSVTALPGLEFGPDGSAVAIAENGRIAGQVKRKVDGGVVAVRWDGTGAPVRLETMPDAADTRAWDIDEQGTVVGREDRPLHSRAARWDVAGHLTELPADNTGYRSIATALKITPSGLILGALGYYGAIPRGVIWR
ncbi:hypothetical protein [Actinokineospora enzanensis]|uniref:hypothetical protein n=1 Tax=Actinokineospora enzanensis TaxID=155975 RepID=UPI00035EAC16|nr:hypothetical protein [Actinokineospora enzanensis]